MSVDEVVDTINAYRQNLGKVVEANKAVGAERDALLKEVEALKAKIAELDGK